MQSLADRAQNNQADYFDEASVSRTVGGGSQGAPFSNSIALQYYWTSTTNVADTSGAWAVFSCDFAVYDVSTSSTDYMLAVS